MPPRREPRRPRPARRDRFERLVTEVLAALPPRFQRYLERVAVVIEDWPDPRDLDELGIGPDETIFGMHRGPAVDSVDASLVTPPLIVIYRGPIEEACATEAEIRHEVRTTVLHEVGHFFGLSEADLDRLGYA